MTILKPACGGSFASGGHFGQVFFADGCHLSSSEAMMSNMVNPMINHEQCGKANNKPYSIDHHLIKEKGGYSVGFSNWILQISCFGNLPGSVLAMFRSKFFFLSSCGGFHK